MKRIFTAVMIAAMLILCVGVAAMADEPEDAELTPVGAEETVAAEEEPVEEAPVEEAPAEEAPAEEPAEEVPAEEAEEAPAEEAEEAPAEDAEPEAEVPATEGTCGEKATWTLDLEDGILTISGEGTVEQDYNNINGWEGVVTGIIIEDGITEIGRNAFSGLYNLEDVIVPASVTKIGAEAFYPCKSLIEVQILNKDCELEVVSTVPDGDITARTPVADTDSMTNPEVVYFTPFFEYRVDDTALENAPVYEELTLIAPKGSQAEDLCTNFGEVYKLTFEEYVDSAEQTGDNTGDNTNTNTGDNTNTNTGDNTNTNTGNNTNTNTGNNTNSNTGNNTNTNTGNNTNTNTGNTSPNSTSPSPSSSSKPSTNSNSNSSNNSNSPKTGDETPVALYIVLVSMLAVAAGCTGIILVKKSRG